ncbi:patatin-domain-containing protein [Lepidopterella palustris CBS 459.81]|uniref:Patatin-domain-containing protein n=1 Tax=Lepidopterella palustris CBS 459.81 TaxID=1314670 RepID=A0A8E2EGA0_9PEZI|nr:patatin-domain-containing protein [Lepidopterella palustris CBS 459.81]
MSFLYDSVLPGTTGLYSGLGTAVKDGQKPLGKCQSHAGFLSPLIQFVRDPVGTIGSTLNHAYETITPVGPDDESHKQALYLRMSNAETYEEWRAAAEKLDFLEGNNTWKLEHECEEYDAALVSARLRQLDDARISCDVSKMLFLIRTSLTRGLGGMGNLRLYKHSHIGTKTLIERYIESAELTLAALLDVSAKQSDKACVEPRVVLEQLLAARQSFGRSALLLSGGGTFGMNHIGVVKCLWKARLLPRIISGASAGSIVCAVLCTKTDAEVPQLLEEFCYGDLNVFEKEGQEDTVVQKAARFLKYGALFDITHLVNVMRNLLGDMTFQESYNRTRRILNITVSSASLYELPRLLNYVTAPNVIIWSAVAASCSVPFIFSAASLLAKDPKTGKEVPWNPTPNAGWIDGSVDNDLPMTRLAEMFNVNHFIVSQVNPHVVPFLMREEDNLSIEARQPTSAFAAGPGWLHNMANLAKGEALHRLHVLAELGVFPNYLTKARSVLNQRYSGDITISPAIPLALFPKVLTNPTTEYMLQCMLTGERATWPKLSRIKNHVAIELALDETIRLLRARIVFSPSQVDLRMNSFGRPLSQGDDRIVRRRASRPPHKVTIFEHDTAPNTMPTIPRRKHHVHVKIPPQTRQVAKPYLPSHAARKYSQSLDCPHPHQLNASDTFSSSTAPEVSSAEESAAETDTSDSISSPSSPTSPSSALPTLWPSTRQLFPSASQPGTPSITSRVFGHRNNSSLSLTMTSKDGNGPSPAVKTDMPSSPELRYRRLFHPSTATAREEALPIRTDLQKGIQSDIQPLAQIQGLSKSELQPESQDRTQSQIPTIPPQNQDLVLSPSSPREMRKANTKAKKESKKESKKEKKERKSSERERKSSRRGSAQGAGLGLLLDISGTRGMMLRRKKSGSKSGGLG